MIFKSPGPLIFDFGFIALRWYGLLTVTGFLLALAYSKYLMKIANHPQYQVHEDFQDCAFWTFVSGIIGARLWFVFLNLDYFIEHSSEIVQIWLGGQSIHGALLGAALGACLYCYKDREKLFFYLSLLVTILPVGQALGRWGNFFNEEAFGLPTKLPWKLYISHTNDFHHPTFLYESIGDCFIALIMFYFFCKASKNNLNLVALYLILYSLLRLFVESLRADSLYLLGIPAANLMSYVLIIIALFFLKKK